MRTVEHPMNPVSILKSYNACQQGLAWVEKNNITTLAEVWAKCERGDWLLWLAAKRGLDRKKLVFVACQCARTALKFTKDERVLKCIETAEAWTRDEVSIEALRRARYTAYAVANLDGLTCAAYAAYAAAYAADDADDAAYAAAYAAYAADAAAYAAYAADAADAARSKALKECADIVRKHLPECP